MADEPTTDRHSLYLREGDRFTVRAQDGKRGAVLGRYEVARVGAGIACRQIGAPCSLCKGQTVVTLSTPVVDTYGDVEKPRNWGTCPRCSGTGLRAVALEPLT